MGRAPCCDKANVKKGPWSPEEDSKLKDFLEKNGTAGNWISLPHKAGLKRCGKSCRLRWLNYLRPNIKHGEFTADEDRIICSLFASIGSRWSIIAAQLPGRTDNDIKNYWNTKLKKKLLGIHPSPLLLEMEGKSISPPTGHAHLSITTSASTNSLLQPQNAYDTFPAHRGLVAFAGEHSCSEEYHLYGEQVGVNGGKCTFEEKQKISTGNGMILLGEEESPFPSAYGFEQQQRLPFPWYC